MKKVVLTLVLAMVLFLSGCVTESDTDRINDQNNDNPDNTELLQLTIEELAMYDGQNGNDAYIAVNGVIYDVTDVPAWTGGTHNGNMAGTDVTNVINNAPHGDSVLDGLVVVGEIVESTVDDENQTLELTIEELAMYDGTNGNPAYIAVDGVIYDVTGVAAWTGGTHNGNMAGTDVSQAIQNAPHGYSVLDGLEQVGVIVE